jgi:hypothetical protein
LKIEAPRRNSHGELLVFVDDDNEIASDYLAIAQRIFSNVANLGIAGGVVEPEWCDQ